MTYVSMNGEGGFPGNVEFKVVYSLGLNEDNEELIMEFSAKTDQSTPICLANHIYFNLNGNYYY